MWVLTIFIQSEKFSDLNTTFQNLDKTKYMKNKKITNQQLKENNLFFK